MAQLAHIQAEAEAAEEAIMAEEVVATYRAAYRGQAEAADRTLLPDLFILLQITGMGARVEQDRLLKVMVALREAVAMCT